MNFYNWRWHKFAETCLVNLVIALFFEIIVNLLLLCLFGEIIHHLAIQYFYSVIYAKIKLKGTKAINRTKTADELKLSPKTYVERRN